jgi:outer membrane protein assembly factor BamB
VAAALAAPASAVSPKYWIHDTAAELLAGEADGVSILGEGTLRLAPRLDLLAEPEAPYVWDVAATADGRRIYAGTGDDGWVLEIEGGDVRNFFQCAAYEVLAVAVGPGGEVYAGTAPEGFVYRISPAGEGSVLFDAEESYVWDLAFGPDGKLYAAVGTKGAVYRIDAATGEADRFFSTDDNHVVCLAFDGPDLIVGTEGRGLVVRVAPDGAVRVLHDCPQGEVGAVLPGRDGVVWAAAAATAEAREEARTESSDQADANGEHPGREDDFEDPFFFDVSPAGAGDGVLYRIDAAGNAFRVWDSGHGAIFDLAAGPDGSVLAVTGESGAVYTVDADASATLVLDAEEDQIVAVAPAGDGWVLGTANPSRVYRLGRQPRSDGTYTSEVLDAQRVARWGRIEWTGEEGGGRVRLSVRAGNTDSPDDTWSPWKETAAGLSAATDVPPARYLQWRARLSGGSDGTRVRRVRVASLENNVPPVVSAVEVLPSGNRFYDDVPELRPRSLYQALPGGVKVQYQFDQGGDPEFPPEFRAPWTQGLRQVRWEALDPNGDILLYDLAYRREDEARWKVFAEEVGGKLYTFNGNGVPDGEYRLRVTASDRQSNPGAPAEASAVSEVFVVDNTAPDFEGLKHERNGDDVRITGEIRDELSDVIRLETSVDGEDWVDRDPADGIFDSPRERIDVRVTAPSGEEHSVLLRGTDQAGNLGAARILLRP